MKKLTILFFLLTINSPIVSGGGFSAPDSQYPYGRPLGLETPQRSIFLNGLDESSHLLEEARVLDRSQGQNCLRRVSFCSKTLCALSISSITAIVALTMWVESTGGDSIDGNVTLGG